MTSEDWDPMLRDYHDSQFNRYIQGVGRDLMNEHNKGAKLFIDYFPTALGQEGLENLFSEFGEVLDARLKPSNRPDKKLSYGFVTMDSAVAAEHAISRWNQRSLKSGCLPLKVMPAFTPEEKKRRQQTKEMEAQFMSSLRGNFNREDDLMSSVSTYGMRPDPLYENRSYGYSRADHLDEYECDLGLSADRGMHRESTRIMGGRGFRSEPTHMIGGRGFRSEPTHMIGGRGMWHESSHMTGERVMRPGPGHMIGGRGIRHEPSYMIGGRGMQSEPRHISMIGGRGRPNFGRDLPEHLEGPERVLRGLEQDYSRAFIGGRGRGRGFSVDQTWSGVSNTRSVGRGFSQGLLQHPTEINQPRRPKLENLKTCVYCGNDESTFRCGACKMYYCSAQCQRKDWPDHRQICLDISIHNFKIKTEMTMNGTATLGSYMDQDNSDRDSDISGRNGKMFRTKDNISDSESGRQSKNDKNLKQNGRGYESEMDNKTSQGIRNVKSSHKNIEKDKFDSVKENKSKQFDRKVEPKSNDYQKSKGNVQNGSMRVHNSSNSNAKSSAYLDEKKKDFSDQNDRDKNQEGKFNERKKTRGPDNRQKPKPTVQNAEEKMKTPNKITDSGDTEEKKKTPNKVTDSHPSPKKKNKALSSVEEKVGSADASLDLVGQTLDKGSAGECYISHYESPSKFWINLKEDVPDFFRISEDFKMLTSKEPKWTVKKVKAGELYSVIYDTHWTRVKVITVNKDNTLTVFFPDTGQQEVVTMADLYPLDEDMRLLPAQAVCCCVGEVKANGKPAWDEKAKQWVKSWLGEAYCKDLTFTVVDKRGNTHALKMVYKKEDLSEQMILAGLAESSSPSFNLPKLSQGAGDAQIRNVAKVERFMAKDLKSIANYLEEDDKVTVSITNLEHPLIFIVLIINSQSTKTIDKVEKIIEEMKLDQGKPYSPVKGELVLAKFTDGKWYRAQVNAIQDKDFQLIFVDYGNEGNVTAAEIRCIEDKALTTLPMVIASLELKGLDPNMDIQAAHNVLSDALGDFMLEDNQFTLLIKGKKGSRILGDFVSWSMEQPFTLHLQEKVSGKKLSPSKELSPVSKPSTAVSPKVKPTVDVPATVCSKSRSQKGDESVTMTMASLPQDGTLKVVVNYVENCGSFYVMLASNYESLCALMSEISTCVKSAPLLENPVVGNYALAEYDEDKVWYRAQIKSVTDQQKCKVFFVDYGNSEGVPPSSLRCLPSSASALPMQAIHCSMDVASVTLDPKASSELKAIEMRLFSISVLRKLDTGDKYIVKVLAEDGTDLLETLVVPTAPQSSVEVKKSPKSKSSQEKELIVSSTLKVGEEIQSVILHIQSICEFYVYSPEQDISEMSQLLQDAAPLSPVLKELCKGMFCAAKFESDETWYRAQITAVLDGGTCIVKFIDYGNSQEVTKKDVRELPDFAMILPASAIPCCFKEFENFIGVEDSNSELSAIHNTKQFAQMKEYLGQDTSPKIVTLTVHHLRSEVAIVSLLDDNGDNIVEKFQLQQSVTASPASPKPAAPKPAARSPATPSPTAPSPATLSDIPKANTPKCSNIEVICTNIDSVQEFWCHKKDKDLEIILNLSETLAVEVANTSPVSPSDAVKGCVFACMFAETWYRCVIEEVRGEKVFIRYIDFGNGEEKNIPELRMLQPSHLSVPISVMKCRLHGIKIDESTPEKLEESQKYARLLEIKMNDGNNHLVMDVIDQHKDNSYLVTLSIVTDNNDRVNIAEDLTGIGLAELLQTNTAETPTVDSNSKGAQEVLQEEEEDEDERQLRELQRQMEAIQLRKNKKK